jgi:hypothetical protein
MDLKKPGKKFKCPKLNFIPLNGLEPLFRHIIGVKMLKMFKKCPKIGILT